jgi:hypothetical protein
LPPAYTYSFDGLLGVRLITEISPEASLLFRWRLTGASMLVATTQIDARMTATTMRCVRDLTAMRLFLLPEFFSDITGFLQSLVDSQRYLVFAPNR